METPSEMSTLMDLIRIYAKDHYVRLEPEQLKEEAERLQKQLSNESAGRVFNFESPEEREIALARMNAYFEDKKEWNKLFKPRTS